MQPLWNPARAIPRQPRKKTCEVGEVVSGLGPEFCLVDAGWMVCHDAGGAWACCVKGPGGVCYPVPDLPVAMADPRVQHVFMQRPSRRLPTSSVPDSSTRQNPVTTTCRTPGAKPAWGYAGSGKDKCTSGEKEKVALAVETAFSWIDGAKQFLDALAKMNLFDRSMMWDWGWVTPNSIHFVIAQDAGELFSPATWFGRYTDSRFDTVRGMIYRLWRRYISGTKNGKIEFKCRSHKQCFDVSAAYSSPLSVGTYVLCDEWFNDSDENKRTRYLLHETMHFLVDDSVLTNRPRDVVDKDICSQPFPVRDLCYGTENSQNLLEKSPSEALKNIDNYVYWMRALAQVGCWPPQNITIGYGFAIPEWWVPPHGIKRQQPPPPRAEPPPARKERPPPRLDPIPPRAGPPRARPPQPSGVQPKTPTLGPPLPGGVPGRAALPGALPPAPFPNWPSPPWGPHEG